LAATIVNSNPFREEGRVAKPWHFDIYGIMDHPPKPQRCKSGVRVGAIKTGFVEE
jgi:hypothetical protein